MCKGHFPGGVQSQLLFSLKHKWLVHNSDWLWSHLAVLGQQDPHDVEENIEYGEEMKVSCSTVEIDFLKTIFYICLYYWKKREVWTHTNTKYHSYMKWDRSLRLSVHQGHFFTFHCLLFWVPCMSSSLSIRWTSFVLKCGRKEIVVSCLLRKQSFCANRQLVTFYKMQGLQLELQIQI